MQYATLPTPHNEKSAVLSDGSRHLIADAEQNDVQAARSTCTLKAMVCLHAEVAGFIVSMWRSESAEHESRHTVTSL